jgi:endoglucanase
MGTSPPFAIDSTWLARVHEVVGWGLALNFTVLINSHHDDWLDNSTTFDSQFPRFIALWTQVAASFASAPPNLLFEVFNEFHEITVVQANTVYATIVPIMRSAGGGNGVRPIYLGGLQFMSAYWILNNPDGIVFPRLPGGGVDPNLRLETHSYDPWGFCGQLPPTQQSWGSASDVAAVVGM